MPKAHYRRLWEKEGAKVSDLHQYTLTRKEEARYKEVINDYISRGYIPKQSLGDSLYL